MAERVELRRMNFYVNPDDLEQVARELGCRPSEVVRRLIDNYLLATEIDEARRMPGAAPEEVFRQSPRYPLPDPSEDGDLEPIE